MKKKLMYKGVPKLSNLITDFKDIENEEIVIGFIKDLNNPIICKKIVDEYEERWFDCFDELYMDQEPTHVFRIFEAEFEPNEKNLNSECDCSVGPATKNFDLAPCGKYVLGFYKIDNMSLSPVIVKRQYMGPSTHEWYNQDGEGMDPPYKIALFNSYNVYKD